MALHEGRRGIQQEPEQRTVGLGQVERALEGAFGRAGVAERVPGDRLQQERLSQPGRPDQRCGAVENRGERGGRGVRVVLGEP